MHPHRPLKCALVGCPPAQRDLLDSSVGGTLRSGGARKRDRTPGSPNGLPRRLHHGARIGVRMPKSVDRPLRQAPGPQTAIMTACEVLTWIALGTALTKEKLDQDGLDAVFLWSSSDLAAVLTALDARASSEPFYAVVRYHTGFQDDWRYVTRCLSPEGPRTLRWIRARARERIGRLVSYADLAATLRAEIEGYERVKVLLRCATKELLEVLRSEKMTAFGQRHFPNGDPNIDAPHEPIPLSVFINPNVTITLWNQVTINHDADAATWSTRPGMTYSDVRFKTADVLWLRPVQSGSADSVSPSEEALPPAPNGGRSEAGRRSPFRADLFRAEYKLRVERWKLEDRKFDPPSPDADLKWAEGLFNAVPRWALREARRTIAPEIVEATGQEKRREVA